MFHWWVLVEFSFYLFNILVFLAGCGFVGVLR